MGCNCQRIWAIIVIQMYITIISVGVIAMTDVLERITELRKARGWTLYKLAEEAMIPQSTLSNMFSRKTLPTIFTLNQICEAFGITLSEFFEETFNVSDETRLISVFRQIRDEDKQILLSIAEILRKKGN